MVVVQAMIIIIMTGIIVTSYVKCGIFIITLNLFFDVFHQSFTSIAQSMKIVRKLSQNLQN